MTSTTETQLGKSSNVLALRFHDREDIRLEQVGKLLCGSDEVRLDVAYCGICGTDIMEYLHGPIFPPARGKTHSHTGVALPVTLGHEISGTISEVGSNVHDLKVGQSVAVNPACDHRHYEAESCNPCKSGRYNVCDDTTTYGLSAPGGGFCQDIVVNAMNCIALPAGVSLKAAALVEPLSVAHHCISESGFQKGQTVLVCGAGPIGLAILLILRVMGASKIIVTEVLQTRIAQAESYGADIVLNPLESQDGVDAAETTLKSIKAMTVDGVDVAFDATGLQSSLDLAIASTKPRGVIFNVAIHKKPLSLNLNTLSFKEKTLKGGICYSASDFEAVVQMLADGSLNAEKMITSIVQLSNIIEGGFEQLIHHREDHVKILIQP